MWYYLSPPFGLCHPDSFQPHEEYTYPSQDQNVFSRRELTHQEPELLSFSLLLLSVQNNLGEKPPNIAQLLDLKGQEYLLFRMYLERDNSEKLLALAVFLVFAHIVLDAFTISPCLVKYTPYWGQWKKAEGIFSSRETPVSLAMLQESDRHWACLLK